MNLRVSMLLACLLTAATISGQAPQPATPSATGGTNPANGASTPQVRSASGAPGALQVPAGQTGTARRTGRSRGSRASGGVSNGNSGARASQPPAPAETASIQVTGFPSSNAPGTADRPLLPISGIGNALGIPSGTPIRVRLRAPIDSGHAHNGDMVDGTLDAPIGNLPAGTPVRLTVVQSAPAGTIASYGELSIQVVSVADRRILSNTITAVGKPGPQELPDAAPARGTEASFTPDQPISLPTA